MLSTLRTGKLQNKRPVVDEPGCCDACDRKSKLRDRLRRKMHRPAKAKADAPAPQHTPADFGNHVHVWKFPLLMQIVGACRSTAVCVKSSDTTMTTSDMVGAMWLSAKMDAHRMVLGSHGSTCRIYCALEGDESRLCTLSLAFDSVSNAVNFTRALTGLMYRVAMHPKDKCGWKDELIRSIPGAAGLLQATLLPDSQAALEWPIVAGILVACTRYELSARDLSLVHQSTVMNTVEKVRQMLERSSLCVTEERQRDMTALAFGDRMMVLSADDPRAGLLCASGEHDFRLLLHTGGGVHALCLDCSQIRDFGTCTCCTETFAELLH
jgi:hypothetical protein